MNMMTRLLMVAALALTSVAAAAHTPARIDTAAFSIVNPWSASAEVLLSDADGVTRIGLASAASDLSAATSSYQQGSFYGGLFEVTVHAGYRVTGFAFSGIFEGVLEVPPNPDGSPGDGVAYNSGYVEFSAGSRPYGVLYSEHAQRIDMLDGAVPFSMASGPLALSSDFNLSLQGLIMVSAYPTVTPEHPEGIDSFASMRLANPMFTIYTTAVPEPASYAMLLAGMAVLETRRRRLERCRCSAAKSSAA